jgi:hypothetical protein
MNDPHYLLLGILWLCFVAVAVYFCRALYGTFQAVGRPDLLSKRHITRQQLAEIEEKLDRLERVTVIADRLTEPDLKLHHAISDNVQQGVKYHYFVSKQTTDSEMIFYHRFLKSIQATNEAVNGGQSYTNARMDDRPSPTVEKQASMGNSSFYDLQRIEYDLNDFPYVCYEYEDAENEIKKVLMYRGTQKGVGIADRYERVSEPVAYSLVTRMRFLSALLPSDQDSYLAAAEGGGLQNKPASTKLRLVPDDSRTPSGNRT